MTTDLRPYSEYNDSGLPWLSRIPAHWEENRAKYYLREVDERSATGDEQLLSVSHVTGVTPRKASVTMFMAESNTGHKVCRQGDLVINTMWAWMAAMGVARQVGLVSPSYGVYRPLRDDLYAPEYVDHLLRTQPYASEYLCRSTGIRASRLRLYPEDFLGTRIIRPPLDEQEAIVRFIRHHDQSIRRFILNRRRLIDVLNEQKQAIINRAVMRGLDPDVRLKPTGIEWLGDIPEHWRVLKIKRIAQVNPSRSEALHMRKSDEAVVFLPMERVSADGEIDVTERRPIRDVWQGFTYFRRGDVVVAKITPCFENGKGACLSELATELGFGTTELIVLRPSQDVTAEFLYQLTKITQFRLLGVESMTGAAGQQRVCPDFVADFVAPVPPRDEQEEITAFIRSETVNYRASIDRAQREVDLICGYRTRLIADVVTGKLDVRGTAAAIDDPITDADDPGEGMDDHETLRDDEPELAEEDET